ncbi:MAG TPA: GDSL-type esterase/lipase family protein, partial [Candidatus Dormibacteraeota bacterium]
LNTLLLVLMLVAPAARAADRSILVFGDSISTALGIAQARGWVALLGERVKRERLDYSVVNASLSGETTSGWAPRLPAALERYRPAVVIIEHNASLDPRRCLVQPYDPDRRWDGSAFFGASLGALRRLGASRGYRLVAVELTGTNAFLVREDLAQPFAEAVAPRAANYLLSGMTHPEPGEPAGYLDLEAGVPGPG